MPPIEVFVPGCGSTGEMPEVQGEYSSRETKEDGTPFFTIKIADLKRKGPNGQGEIKSILMEVVPYSAEREQRVNFNGRSCQSINPEAEIIFPGGRQKARVIYHRGKSV